MKKKLFTILFLFIATAANAQNKYVDSLKAVLNATIQPLKRFDLLNKIYEDVFIDGDGNIDSASCIEMITIAENPNNDSLLAISYNMIANFFFLTKGDNTTGLEYLFKAIPLAEKVNDKRRLSSIYLDIAYVYTQLQNVEEAIKYNRKGADNLPDKSSSMYDFMIRQYQDNMADCFLRLHRPDSALHYAQALNETNQRLRSRYYDAVALRELAGVQEQLGDTAFAVIYYNKAIVIVDSMSHYNSKFYTKMNYASFLIDNNKTKQARVQATQLFQLGVEISNDDMKLAGATLLRRIYDKLNRTDSAYYYSRMESDINASIFSQDNLNKTQALAFNEKLRLIEEADRVGDEARQRKRNIQYELLAFGIITFIILFFLLSRSVITNTKVIEFLGVIALLIVFEFLNLLLHPVLEQVTHHSPVLMLLGLVCIAALLVPAHHKLEHWATAKLVEKNKQLRLAAAKKTIIELERSNSD